MRDNYSNSSMFEPKCFACNSNRRRIFFGLEEKLGQATISVSRLCVFMYLFSIRVGGS